MADVAMEDARPLKRQHVDDAMDVDEPPTFMSSPFNFVAHAPATPPLWASRPFEPAPDALFSRLRVASPPLADSPRSPRLAPPQSAPARTARSSSVPLDLAAALLNSPKVAAADVEPDRQLVLTGDGRTEARRRRRGEQRRTSRRERSRDRADEVDELALAPSRPAPHLSLHQHHYGAPASMAPLPAPSHWWRQDAPLVLLGYTQFAFNASCAALAIALLVTFLRAIASDASNKVDRFSDEIAQEILQCSSAYVANKCSPDERVPMLRATCESLEHCMQRNAKAVPRARVFAETVAETINSFVEAISWRTMLFLLLTAAIVISLTNATLGGARHRLQQDTAREIELERLQRQLEQSRQMQDRPSLEHTKTAPAALPSSAASTRRGWFGR